MGPRHRGEDRAKWARQAAQASHVGIMLVVAISLGWAVGQWLDARLGTDPWLTAVFALLGAAAGFIQLFRIALSICEDDEAGKGGP